MKIITEHITSATKTLRNLVLVCSAIAAVSSSAYAESYSLPDAVGDTTTSEASAPSLDDRLQEVSAQIKMKKQLLAALNETSVGNSFSRPDMKGPVQTAVVTSEGELASATKSSDTWTPQQKRINSSRAQQVLRMAGR